MTSTASGAPVSISISICRADYGNPLDAAALIALLDSYALDPAGGGVPLRDNVKQGLVDALRQRPQAFSVLAWAGQPQAAEGRVPVGLVNCFEGFSTFACQPLVNVHDVVVLPAWRASALPSAC